MKKFLILIASALIGMSACNINPDDNFIIYNLSEMVTVESGIIITDNNLIYEVIENETNAKLDEYHRAIIVCDILKLNDNGSYQIKLKSITKIQEKDCLNAESLPDGAVLSDLPISPRSIWFSGGYLNVELNFYFKEGSPTTHVVDLIARRPESSDKPVTLYLRHTAEGETAHDINYDDYTLVGSYISFKADEFIPENATTPIEIKWNWFRDSSSPNDSDIIEYSDTGEIVRKN